jgi:hypothetical protein
MGRVVVVREGNVAKFYLTVKSSSLAERGHSGNTEAAAGETDKQLVRTGRRNPICSFLKELGIKCPYNRATNGKENKSVRM